MTLATVSRYDPTRVSEVGDRAVVVGGSIAGLLAARVLADGFEEVTLIERDPRPDEPTARRGTPQGRHLHVLLESGRATFEDLFPGYGEELLSAGGLLIDAMSHMIHYQKGDFLADGQTRLPMYSATRPLFEQVIRQRVAEHNGVDIRSGCQFTDYLTDDTGTTVEGVQVRDESAEQVELSADLVVDATGRTSKTPTWLDNHGYTAPSVDEVKVDLAYSTIAIERPVDDRRFFFIVADPPRTRGAGVLPVEDGRWLATLAGFHGDHPPTDAEGLREFAASLPVPIVSELFETRPWLSDEIAHYPFPSNRRHRYENLDRFPDGLVVIGDAISSFNPVYGQGMSVAALEALVMHHTLTDGREGLAFRFFDRIEEIVDVPWSIAVGGDFEFPQTTGPKPRGTDLLNRYMSRLIRKAHTDSELRGALYRVFSLEHPPQTLFRPGVVWRVLKPTRQGIGSATQPASEQHSAETPPQFKN